MIRPPPKSTLFPYPTLSRSPAVSRPPSSAEEGNSPRPSLSKNRREQLEKEVARSPDRKSTRPNSRHPVISYAGFCLKKKKKQTKHHVHSRVTTSTRHLV